MNPVVASVLACASASCGAVCAGVAWRKARAKDLEEQGITDERMWSVWRSVLRSMSKALAPTGGDREEMISKLSQAGRNGSEELERFLEEKLLGYLLGAAFGLSFFLLIGGKGGVFLLLLSLTAGVLIPAKRLEIKANERKQSIGAALPGAVDLLMTCIDAGLSVEQAIKRVSKEYVRSSPVLAEEFGICATECEAGVSLSDALKRTARRVEHDDLSGLCSVIGQAHELGAPIVQTLADYADSTRKVRMAKLEEWAAKLAMKLLIPAVMFLLAALVVMLGPSLMSVIDTMKGY